MLEPLLDVRDGTAEAKCLVAAAWLACGSPILDQDTAAALCALTIVAREQLDDLLAALDAVIVSVSTHDG